MAETVMKRRACSIAPLLFLCTSCLAQAWNDYRFDVGDGYQIVRGNSVDVFIAKDHQAFLVPTNYPDVGPIIRYAITNQCIFTQNWGRKPRNLFKGDTYQEVDPNQEFFFVFVKGENREIGPLSRLEFDAHPVVTNAGALDWTVQRNPHPFRGPCLLILIVFLFVPFWLACRHPWFSIPVLLIVAGLVAHRVHHIMAIRKSHL